MADNYVYLLDGRAYVNITNRCANACAFCIRNTGDGVKDTPLWLEREPTADDVMRAFAALEGRTDDEIVFCGFGEPTEKMDVLAECAKRFKAAGYRLRLNTNGLGSLVNCRDISKELKDFDVVSVSLNQANTQKYAEITRSKFGDAAFGAVLDFARSCKNAGIAVVFTVVDTIGVDDIEECKAVAEKLGIPLRVREYVPDNYN